MKTRRLVWFSLLVVVLWTGLGWAEQLRVRLRTTNGMERLTEEIRRRERAIRIFSNEASAVRLIGTLLVEPHAMWSTGKRSFDMTESVEWKTL